MKIQTVFEFMLSLKPAIPMSTEHPCTHMSNGELRRLLNQGACKINGAAVNAQEKVDFPVFSIVWFPKSAQRRTTIL